MKDHIYRRGGKYKKNRSNCGTAWRFGLLMISLQKHASGKPRAEIIKDYELTPSSYDKWVRQYQNSGSFQEKDNRTSEQEELVKLRKEKQQLTMENGISKQATLIMGRK
ncbi:transposase [Gracilibacillus kekensis]|uniref:Transposase n=1 Tax=Gracilibacillus kekensis TaxID=1027249 RepID=A0A1M7QTF6_9BACI|nr:transposase [Gracilibacillus kekensis]